MRALSIWTETNYLEETRKANYVKSCKVHVIPIYGDARIILILML